MFSRRSALVLTAFVFVLSACGGEGEETVEDQTAGQTGEMPGEPVIEETPEMAYASHILIPFQGCMQAPADAATREEAYELLSSIADSIDQGLITFEEAASRHSSCPSGESGGFLGGFFRGDMVPEFDSVVFNMAPGNTSEVFETGYGYHIVYRHPTVTASHILIAYQGAERSTATRTREEALELIETIRDSIYADQITFEDAAMRYSDCPSAQSGGDLGPFSRNVMTPAFEDSAFALEVGEISDVVETEFGYHLIMRTE